MSGDEGSARPEVRGLAHIALAVHQADPVARTLERALGAKRGAEEIIDGGALRLVFVHAGALTFELLEPLDPAHTVAKFLEARGPGLHHVALDVDDIDALLARCREAGVRAIDETPRAGAHGSRVAFLHPKSLSGVLLELRQKADERP